MKKLVLIFLFIIIGSSILNLSAIEKEAEDRGKDYYKNILDINPTSDGFYIGYDRVLLFSKKAILVFDVKNTTENGDDFGRSGFTFRYGLSASSLFSSRIETAWIEGQNNIAVKLGYDSSFFGCSLTGVRSLSDPEIIKTQETILSSSSVSTDIRTGSSGGYDIFNRQTTKTDSIQVTDMKIATPDGLLLDFNFNFFEQFHFSLGGSHWESDDYEETGYHGNFTWQITKGDALGGHIAHVNDETEGGIYYRKSFSSFRDIFTKGEPLENIDNEPILNKLAFVPFSTPPIKIMTSAEYEETRIENRISVTSEEIRVKRDEPAPVTVITPKNNNPSISVFTTDGGTAGSFTITGLSASDSDGSVVSWSVSSSIDGNLASGSWPMGLPNMISPPSNVVHTITVRVTDNDGGTASRSTVVNTA